jgi:hypothetical protein
MFKFAILIFGAGVAWGAVKIEARVTQDRQQADHVVLFDHEDRIRTLESCYASMAATQEGILTQLTQMNESVQSINEFLRDAAQNERED